MSTVVHNLRVEFRERQHAASAVTTLEHLDGVGRVTLASEAAATVCVAQEVRGNCNVVSTLAESLRQIEEAVGGVDDPVGPIALRISAWDSEETGER